MNRCKRCGRNYQSQDRFCGFCGFNLAAQETSEMATRLAMKSSEIHFNLGLRYFNEAKYAEALSAFEKTQEEDPDDERIQEMIDRTRSALDSQVNSPTT
jgi:tetratricopeptide (TPR) repeat protein